MDYQSMIWHLSFMSLTILYFLKVLNIVKTNIRKSAGWFPAFLGQSPMTSVTFCPFQDKRQLSAHVRSAAELKFFYGIPCWDNTSNYRKETLVFTEFKTYWSSATYLQCISAVFANSGLTRQRFYLSTTMNFFRHSQLPKNARLTETTRAPWSLLLQILMHYEILPFALVIKRVFKGVKLSRCKIFNLQLRNNRRCKKMQHWLQHGGNPLTALQS